mgnify:CR=1 FL=1
MVSAMARDAGLGEALGWIGTMQGVAAVAVEAGPLDDAMYLLRPEPGSGAESSDDACPVADAMAWQSALPTPTSHAEGCPCLLQLATRCRDIYNRVSVARDGFRPSDAAAGAVPERKRGLAPERKRSVGI